MERRETLSLNEWAVLACLVERPSHGYDIAAELAPGTELGTVWRVSRQLVYRALDRLAALGLAEPLAAEPGAGGPPRQVFGSTAAGRERLSCWLREPVAHLRDVRGPLLLKLVVARRLAVDAGPLVAAQQARFARPLASLASPASPAPPPDGPPIDGPPTARPAGPQPLDDPVALWRHHSALAVRAFLADLADLAHTGSPQAAGADDGSGTQS
jgi:PadR family transcriptional regulator AphA